MLLGVSGAILFLVRFSTLVSCMLILLIHQTTAQQALNLDKVAKLPVGVLDMGYCASETAIFSIGGKIVQGGEMKQTEVIMLYSPYTDEWSKALFTSNHIAVKGTSVSAYVPNVNSIYTLALSQLDDQGQIQYPLEIFNISNYRLTYDANNPHKAAQAGIASDQDHIYLFGGYGTNADGESVLSDALYRLNAVTGEWDQLSSLPEGRRAKGVICNGRLYVVGGENQEGLTAEVLRYNLSTHQWSRAGYLPFAAEVQAITSSGEYIFIATGTEQTNKLLAINTITNNIDQFDIRFGYQKPGMVIMDGFLYLFGGYAPRSNTANRRAFRISLSTIIGQP